MFLIGINEKCKKMKNGKYSTTYSNILVSF